MIHVAYHPWGFWLGQEDSKGPPASTLNLCNIYYEYLIFWLNPFQHIWSLQLYWMPSGSWKWMPLEKYCSFSKFHLQQVGLFKIVSPFSQLSISTSMWQNCQNSACAGCPVGHGWLAKVPWSNGLPWSWSCHVLWRWSLGFNEKSCVQFGPADLPASVSSSSFWNTWCLGEHFKELQGWQTASLHEMTEIIEMMWADMMICMFLDSSKKYKMVQGSMSTCISMLEELWWIGLRCWSTPSYWPNDPPRGPRFSSISSCRIIGFSKHRVRTEAKDCRRSAHSGGSKAEGKLKV